jgi:hypothetical protein
MKVIAHHLFAFSSKDARICSKSSHGIEIFSSQQPPRQSTKKRRWIVHSYLSWISYRQFPGALRGEEVMAERLQEAL